MKYKTLVPTLLALPLVTTGNAYAIDAAAAATAISDGSTQINVIGLAVLGVLAGMFVIRKLYMMTRSG